ncbi:hypothetical protein HaLaN_14085 [Haematococcus lacustris]|uniref:Uncharacterized protein n=1 Tax=Haematococcus lacustris TaxID=44745 RepID=A0A699ZE47_HAELA|nr:hypothetical protein HaLaN_14085 [Haematococcus lacustris]
MTDPWWCISPISSGCYDPHRRLSRGSRVSLSYPMQRARGQPFAPHAEGQGSAVHIPCRGPGVSLSYPMQRARGQPFIPHAEGQGSAVHIPCRGPGVSRSYPMQRVKGQPFIPHAEGQGAQAAQQAVLAGPDPAGHSGLAVHLAAAQLRSATSLVRKGWTWGVSGKALGHPEGL